MACVDFQQVSHVYQNVLMRVPTGALVKGISLFPVKKEELQAAAPKAEVSEKEGGFMKLRTF